MRSAPSGFTLIELLVVMTVAAIMLAIGVPSFKSFIAAQRVKSTSYEISTSLLLARSEAIKRNANVTVTPTTAGAWTSGWTVATTGATPVALQNQAAIGGITITKAPTAAVTFQSSGRTASGSISYWEITGSSGARCVRLDTAGVANTASGACP